MLLYAAIGALTLSTTTLAAEPAPPDASAARAPTDDGEEGTADASEAREVRILWAGARAGIGSGRVRFRLLDAVQSADALDVAAVRPVHGWVVRGRWALVAEDRTLASTLKLFEGDALDCAPPEQATRLQTADETLILAGERRDLGRTLGIRALPVAVRSCTVGDTRARLVGPAAGALPKLDLSRWETRLALTWTLADGTVLDSLGRPDAEGTRRFAALRLSRSQADLFVDAGRFVDGVSSVRDGDLSLHRPTGFALLQDLDPAALVPGSTELAGGPAALLDEAPELPWTAANWTVDEDASALLLPDQRTADLDDGLRIAFVGVVDPTLAERDPRFAEDGVTLSDPVSAAQGVIDRLREAEDPPDLVVVLTSAEAPVLNRLRTELRGADAILGDRDEDVRRLARLRVQLRQDATATPAESSSLTLPLGGVQLAHLRMDGDALAEVDVRPIPVPLTVTPDPATLARVTAVRARAYPALEDPLLHPQEPTGTIQPADFDKAACEALLDATQADLALLPRLPDRDPVPGPLTALLVAERLAMPDHVEVHRIPGDRYRTLLDRAFGLPGLTCGSPLGERFPRARGRFLEDQRLYTVVTTDRLRANTALDGLLSAARSPWLLDRSEWRTLTTPEGTPRSLRSVTIDSLRRLRDTHGDDLLAHLLERGPTDWPTFWDLRVRQLSLRAEGFQGVDDEAYSQIPETRATSPSSLTVGTAADVALEYSSSRALWDVRARTQFTRLRTAQGPQETADDAKLSSSVTLPAASIDLGPTAIRPFSEALLDSELTPTETDAGVQNPRQADVSLTVGLSTPITGWLRALRVGVLVLQDLAVIDKRAELGARLEGQTRVFFGPGMVWTNQLDAFVYGDTPDQDASDLRFKVFYQTRVGLTLSRWLATSIFADAFVFQGRVPETRQVSGSFTLGASVDVSGVFSL